MTALHSDAMRLIADVTARGISVQVNGSRLEVTPKSLLTDDDRSRIRRLKTSLIAYLAPCESHFDSSGWKREPLADRPGWERASCRRCGKFIGFNPIRHNHERDLDLNNVGTGRASLSTGGGDGGDGGDESRHLRANSEKRLRATG